MVFTDSTISCYDIVSMVTEEASERFAPTLSVSEEAEDFIKSCCDVIDILSDEFHGVAYECEVLDGTNKIAISLICPEIIISKPDHIMHTLVEYAEKVSIENTDDNKDIRITFIFPGIWKRSF